MFRAQCYVSYVSLVAFKLTDVLANSPSSYSPKELVGKTQKSNHTASSKAVLCTALLAVGSGTTSCTAFRLVAAAVRPVAIWRVVCTTQLVGNIGSCFDPYYFGIGLHPFPSILGP